MTEEHIIRTVCDHFNITEEQLKQKTRKHHITTPRQIAMYLGKSLYDFSYYKCSSMFGLDHSTAIHAYKTTKDRMETNTNFKKTVMYIQNKVESLSSMPDVVVKDVDLLRIAQLNTMSLIT